MYKRQTLLDVAGLAPEEGQVCDGVRILPLLQGKEIPERPVFWHYPHYGNQGDVYKRQGYVWWWNKGRITGVLRDTEKIALLSFRHLSLIHI